MEVLYQLSYLGGRTKASAGRDQASPRPAADRQLSTVDAGAP